MEHLLAEKASMVLCTYVFTQNLYLIRASHGLPAGALAYVCSNLLGLLRKRSVADEPMHGVSLL
jgi:hypothetical protein